MEKQVRRYDAFVPAQPQRQPQRYLVQQHELQLPQPVQLHAAPRGELDRAVGFLASTAGLSFVVGLGGALIAVGAWGVPALSATTLAVFFGVSMLVWLTSWLAHLLLSETGVALLAVLLQYRLLRHEQKLRHEIFEEDA